jgi:hypothetical protein
MKGIWLNLKDILDVESMFGLEKGLLQFTSLNTLSMILMKILTKMLLFNQRHHRQNPGRPIVDSFSVTVERLDLTLVKIKRKI